jgi:hypothetical protein
VFTARGWGAAMSRAVIAPAAGSDLLVGARFRTGVPAGALGAGNACVSTLVPNPASSTSTQEHVPSGHFRVRGCFGCSWVFLGANYCGLKIRVSGGSYKQHLRITYGIFNVIALWTKQLI